MSMGWHEVRLAALIMLALYAAVALMLVPRELTFLRGVEQPAYRRRFIWQDILIQVGILAVLLPSAILPTATIGGLVIIVAGFTLLWIAAIWAAFSRYSYTYRILLKLRDEDRHRLQEFVEQYQQEDHRGN